MDYNPDTINKLIGSKVASYKSLKLDNTEDEKIKKKDLERKEDNHINDAVDVKDYKEHNDKKEVNKTEDAYTFLLNEIDDAYDSLESEDSYSVKGAVASSGVGAGISYIIRKRRQERLPEIITDLQSRIKQAEDKLEAKKAKGKEALLLKIKIKDLKLELREAQAEDSSPKSTVKKALIRGAVNGALLYGGAKLAQKGAKVIKKGVSQVYNYSDTSYAMNPDTKKALIASGAGLAVGAGTGYALSRLEKKALKPMIKAQRDEINLIEAKLKKDVSQGKESYRLKLKLARAKAELERLKARESSPKSSRNSLMATMGGAGALTGLHLAEQRRLSSMDNFSNEDVAGLQSAAVGALSAPKKKFWQPKWYHKNKTRKHYDKVRRQAVSSVAGIVAEQKGLDPQKAKATALEADSMVAPIGRHGIKATRSGVKKFKKWLND